MTKKEIFEEIKGYLFMLLGCVSYGMSTSLFLQPNLIVAGGISGLSVMLNMYINIPVGTLIILLNIPILLGGLRMQGLKFIVRALITIVTLGVVTDLLALLPPMTSDSVLASLYGGIFQGIGIGCFVKYEFSSGGTELLGRIISNLVKVVKIPLCVGILDGIIVIFGAIATTNPDNMLYALIVIFVSTKVSEIILVGLEKSKLCIIITDKGREMSETLLSHSPRGVTMLAGEGMYTHKNHNVLLTCVKNRQLTQLKQIVKGVDAHAFIIINESVEVRGQGFQALDEEHVAKIKKSVENAVENIDENKKEGGMSAMNYDIIIQAGQSNAEGTGYGEVDEELTVSPNVWYLEAEKTVEVAEDGMKITYADAPFKILPAQERTGENGERIGDFSLTFAEAYEKAGLLADGRKLLIVRAAIGGTGFKKENWGVGKQLHHKLVEMVDYALSLNGENRVVGILWHQGEHDAFEKNPPEIFKAQLAETLADLRGRYGEGLPFIAGDFANEWKSKNLDDCLQIVAKIKEVVEESGNGGFVETADLLSNNQKSGNGDDIHFCRNSLHALGRRYFEAYQKIVK